MGYQKPKSDHPWKTGRMRDYKEIKEKKVKPVYLFIREIYSSWNSIEITTYAYGREGKYKLIDLPQRKQAAWLAGLLKKGYEQI